MSQKPFKVCNTFGRTASPWISLNNMNRLPRIIPTTNWDTHIHIGMINQTLVKDWVCYSCSLLLLLTTLFSALPTTISAHCFSLQAPYTPMMVKSRVMREITYMTCMPVSNLSICGENKQRNNHIRRLSEQVKKTWVQCAGSMNAAEVFKLMSFGPVVYTETILNVRILFWRAVSFQYFYCTWCLNFM